MLLFVDVVFAAPSSFISAMATETFPLDLHCEETDWKTDIVVIGERRWSVVRDGVRRYHSFAIALRLRLLRLSAVVVAVGCCCRVLGRPVFGVSFISFRGFLGSSKSEFFFDSEFDAKDYFKINLSYVRG